MHKNEAHSPTMNHFSEASPRRTARFGRWLLAVLCVAVMSVPAVAVAMDMDQIVQMSEMGLDDRAIMGAIDSAGDDLELDDDDVDEMRDAGVSEDVLAHLRRRGHISSDVAVDDEPDVADEDVDLDDLDDMAPAPAPAEEDESEAERRERERLEREREELRQELEQEQAEEEARQRALEELEQAAATELPAADSLVDSGDNMEAARAYLAFLDRDPEYGGEHWYRATFGLAKALVQEGIYSGAATPLLEVLMVGHEGANFEESFLMLKELTRNIGYQPPVLEELTQFDRTHTSERFQEQFNYYMGKFFYDYNRMDLALEYLDQIPDTAPEYPESRYLAGVAKLDDEVGDIPGALRNFERAIVAAEAAGDDRAGDILQLGYLALARVFFEVGFFDVALYYYEQIPSESARHADAMFESAWSYFMKNDFERALGAFHSLHSPYYAGRYYPELYILEATAYLNLCNFHKSQRALTEFERQYLEQRPALQTFLEETFEPEAYWELMETAYSENGNPKLPRLFTNAVLENLTFYNIFQVVRSLEQERDSLMGNIDVLGEFGEDVLERVEYQLAMNIEEGGIVVQQALTEVDQDLQQWESNAQRIQFDIQNEERDEIRRRMQNPDYERQQAEGGTTLMVVADDWQAWPFEGEYWLDEVDSYRSQMRTECIEP